LWEVPTKVYPKTIFETLSPLNYRERHPIEVKNKKNKKTYKIYCPKPSAFLYHKGATFIDRETEQRQVKDLHYMYFVLRYAPRLDVIFKAEK